MSGPLDPLVKDWMHWLEQLLAYSPLHLRVIRSPHDSDDNDPAVTKAAIHIYMHGANVPAMVGLVTLSPLGDDQNDDDLILAQEVVDDQISILHNTGSFVCFIAHGVSCVTFYYCSDSRAGQDQLGINLVIERAGTEIFDRGTVEGVRLLKSRLMEAIMRNLAVCGGGAEAR